MELIEDNNFFMNYYLINFYIAIRLKIDNISIWAYLLTCYYKIHLSYLQMIF